MCVIHHPAVAPEGLVNEHPQGIVRRVPGSEPERARQHVRFEDRLEDDSQNGVDHVDGHRAPLMIASPYAKRGIVDSSYATQLNVIKTIEQMLGITPMNQEERAAEPMFDAFTNKPDNTPYTVVPNQIPLTLGLTTTPSSARTAAAAPDAATGGSSGPQFAPKSAAQQGVPPAERGVYEQWVVWSRASRFSGAAPVVDWANPAQLGRLDWYSAHDWKVPYPGDAAILPPDQVPGHNLPAGYLGDG